MTRRQDRRAQGRAAPKPPDVVAPALAGARLARVPDWAVLVVFCVTFAVLTLSSVAQKSATFDEPSNLVSGYLELTRGHYWLKPEALPLVKVLAASPLLFLPVKTLPVAGASREQFYDRFLFEANEGERLLMLARAAVLPLSLLLGCLVFVWTRQLFGRGAALFALFLYCFDPNILAHSALVTTDLGVACFLFLTVYGLFRLTGRASIPRLLLTALAFSLAVSTKLSMVPLIAIMVVLGVIASLSSLAVPGRIPGRPGWTEAGRGGKLIGLGVVVLVTSLTAWVVIWALYRFSYSSAASVGPALDWAAYASPGTFLWHALTWFRETRVLPEPYVFSFFYNLRSAGMWPGFLLGEVRQGGWWYYFVVTLLVKTPVPLIVFIGWALVIQARRWRTAALASAFLVVPVVVYFVSISASGFNMGYRHILAVVPFGMVLAGALIPWAAKRPAWVKGTLAALSLWYLTSSLWIHPHYLAYFNELVGGPGNGYKYLVDSNLDWGQDLKGLRQYMEQRGIDRVWLSYFGTAKPSHYGIRSEPLPGSSAVDPTQVRPELRAIERLPRLRGVVAISATHLQGPYLPAFGVNRDYFGMYREAQPIAKIGYSIFVYRFD